MTEALLHAITSIGPWAVILVIYAESGLLIGFLFPGDSLLFTAGFLVHQGAFNINIHLFVALLFIAAVLGDNTGYAFGRRVGRKIFERENSRFFKRKYLEQAEAFYDKHGPIAIVLARFVPIVRTFAPIVGGVGKMHYKTFLAYNILGALLWAVLITYLGYFVGQKLTDMGVNIEVLAIIIVLISIAPIIIHALKDTDRRHKLIDGTKHQIEVLLRRGKKKNK